MSGRVMKIDVWSDIACPWCYIGKRRFAEGARRYAEAGGDRVIELEYHAFELAPDTPVDFEGDEIDFLVHHKGMSEAKVRRLLEQMTATAAEEGLAYDFAALKHTKTLRAHQLLQLAKERGLQEQVKERLLKAYFTEGRHLGHIDSLADLGAEAGLDRAEAVAALEDQRYLPAVIADFDLAGAYGIQGVPFYVIDGRYGVSGAQPPEVFAEVLRKAATADAEDPA